MAVALALAGGATRLRRNAALSPPPEPRPLTPTGRWLRILALAAGLVVTAGVVADALSDVTTDWDGRMTWMATARYVRAAGTVDATVLREEPWYVTHPAYPLLLPLAHVVARDSFHLPEDDRATRVLTAAFLPAALVLLFHLARPFAGTAGAAAATVILALVPMSWSQEGGAVTAGGDLPVAAFFGSGLLLLVSARAPSEGVLAGFLLAGAMLTKNEGLALAFAALLAGASRLPFRRGRTGALRATLLAGVPVAAAAVLLLSWKSGIANRYDEDYGVNLTASRLVDGIRERIPAIVAAMGREMSSAEAWAGLWFAIPLVVVAGLGALRRRPARPLLLAIAASVCVFFAAYLVTPWSGAELVHPTWNRLLLQISFPILVLFAMSARGAAGVALRADPAEAPAASPVPGRAAELGYAALFVFLTVVMTWPWALHIRDTAADAGDPYLNSWIVWWDYHQTFTNPLQLFHGNIFYPSRYSLAFSEHNYGLALPLFPLFALGLRPLTAQSLLTLIGFAFCGYGAFRLTRTLTGSVGAGVIAGIGFAFTPYRFHQLSHVNYLFSGWIPILLEALVLYARKPGRRRAVWLGVAFLMNALTCIHWFVLTLIPLAVTAFVLARRREPKLGLRDFVPATVSVGIAGVALLPFLIPYQRAAKLYGMVRHASENRDFSAHLIHWFTSEPRNHLWNGIGDSPAKGELALFPGLFLLLLPVAALFLALPARPAQASPFTAPSRRRLLVLDALSALAAVVALLATVPPGLRVTLGGRKIFSATDPTRALVLLGALLLVRWWSAYPKAFTFLAEPSLGLSLSRARRPDALVVGLIWASLGVAGSFGMNGPFHRALFDLVFLFRSIRAPSRWAMVAILGLAVLAGVGALELARRAGRRSSLVFGGLALAMLFELRAAPLDLIRGEADPDPVTLRLKATPMKGGIAELPAGGPRGNYRYVLRAADHGKPLITAVSGFASPLVSEIQELSQQKPVPEKLLAVLEGVPTSYLVVHDAWLEPEERSALHEFLAKGMASGRLRFIRRFEKPTRDDLYAVVKNEPDTKSEEEVPWLAPSLPVGPGSNLVEDKELLGSVDNPAEAETVHGELLVRGWARNPGQDLDVTVLIDGEERRPASFIRTPRPGLETLRPNMGSCATAGYESRYAFRPEDEGPHEIQVIFRLGDHVRHYAIRRFTWKAAGPGG